MAQLQAALASGNLAAVPGFQQQALAAQAKALAAGVPGYDGGVGGAGYFFEHPEDIRLYGISFGTDIGGTSVAGEISYRPNMPIQINTGDLSRSALGLGQDNSHRGLERLA